MATVVERRHTVDRGHGKMIPVTRPCDRSKHQAGDTHAVWQGLGEPCWLGVFEKQLSGDKSGKALAAGIAANPDDQEPAASAIPLTYFSNDA